jgi:replication-associated recombination protein RarA
MGKALGDMFRMVPRAVMQVIIDNSAGDIRSAINCANLVAMQVHYSPRVKDVSM